MELNEKEEHMQKLWKTAFLKGRAAARVITFFNDLSRKIYLFGVSKGLDEIQKEDKIPAYILTQHSKFRNIWSIVNILLLVYTATYMPYRIAFVDDATDSIIISEWVIDMLFFTDIIVTFFTAAED